LIDGREIPVVKEHHNHAYPLNIEMHNMTEPIPDDFKSGFIVIAGAPNVGKSTLLNLVLGEKLSITSNKPQTTRNRILGILHRPKSQLIFIDTPGIHRSGKPLNQRIVETALSAFGDVDMILVLVDAQRPDPEAEKLWVQALAKQRRPVILALNKIDLVPKPKLLTLIEAWHTVHPFRAIIPISAKKGTQVEDLVEEMELTLPPGPPLFPADSLTDMPERFLVSEIVREKAFRLTGEEIPYAVAVTIDVFEEKENIIEVYATLHVERNSQKGIIIGKEGRKLKQIGEAARKDIQKMLDSKVFLKLFVRVQKNWTRDTRALRRFGY
jgi:GTP-binding protein Era